MDYDDGLLFDVTESSVNHPKDLYNTRELIVFAIDSTDSMFDTSDNNESPFKISLQCVRSILMRKIIGSSNDFIGIVFYGTREKNSGDQYPKHMITFFEPSQPNADIVKKIDLILKSGNNDQFDNKYGHSEDYSLPDLFWHCSSLIGHCNVKMNIKKIIILTCNDFPHRNSARMQHHVRKKAEDLENLGIILEVIPLKQDFDGELFYNDILKMVNGEDAKVESGESLILQLKEGRYRKDNKKRSLGKLVWNLGKGVELGVDLYCFFRSLSIPPLRKLHRRTNETVKSVTQVYHAETGERLLKSDLNQKIEVGDEQLTFTTDEMEKLSIHEKPGITLLGFKSMGHLNPEYHMQTASFLYPSEETFKGSTKLFKALLEKCYGKEKFALCYIITRVRSKPKLVALVPQKEINNGVQVMPPGFHVIYLPYAEYIRDIELPKKEPVEPEEVDLCKKVLKKVTVKYNVSMFENPKIQTHWANIEALALNSKERREVIDSTLPNYEFVSQCRLKDLESKFINTFYKDDYDPEAEVTRKRKYLAKAQESKQTVKVPKYDPNDPEYVIKMARAGQAEKLTVPILKSFLIEKGVTVNGLKKNDLVNALNTELNIA